VKVKAGSDGDETVTVHVVDGTGKPVTTKVLGTGKVTSKTLDGDGNVQLRFDDGTTKTIVVTPDSCSTAPRSSRARPRRPSTRSKSRLSAPKA
jgi:hypothetical protein